MNLRRQWRKILLNVLAAVWICYSILLVLRALRSEATLHSLESTIGQERQLKHLWSSAAYMWAFATEWIFWNLKYRKGTNKSEP